MYIIVLFFCVDNEVFHEDVYASVAKPVTIKCHASDTSEPLLWDHRRSVDQDVRHVYHGHLVGAYKERCTIDGFTYE